MQWHCQLWGTGAHAPSTSNNCIFSLLWSKSDSQLSKYCVVCEISWCRCQQLTAISISTALVTKLLVIEQLLHSALKFAVSAPWPNFQLCPSSQQSWRRHCSHVLGVGPTNYHTALHTFLWLAELCNLTRVTAELPVPRCTVAIHSVTCGPLVKMAQSMARPRKDCTEGQLYMQCSMQIYHPFSYIMLYSVSYY